MIAKISSTKLFNGLFILITVFGCLVYPAISSAICDLDPTFGNGGIVSTNIPDAIAPDSLITLNNGKFLLTGQLFNGSNQRKQKLVARSYGSLQVE